MRLIKLETLQSFSSAGRSHGVTKVITTTLVGKGDEATWVTEAYFIETTHFKTTILTRALQHLKQ